MGREEGGGFRMGNTCIPVADYVKFKNKIKFKIFKKKKSWGGGGAEISINQIIIGRNVKKEIVTSTMKEHYTML